MLGTIVNALSILAGSIAGLLSKIVFKNGIPERFNNIIMNGLALCILLIGISQALKVNNMLLIIFSIVIGAILGEIIDIDRHLQNLGDNLEKSLKGKGGKVSEGFVSASLLFCVGSMAILGSLESGLTGKHDTLFAKSVLDGVSSVVFSSSLGIGVSFSAVSVFLYQGLITIAASSLKGILTGAVISDMTAVGGLLIIGIGLNMLGITKIKLANLLPGIFVPMLYQLISGWMAPILHMLG
jgi:Uncharacterized membrane protein, possible Na+ channel or pump